MSFELGERIKSLVNQGELYEIEGFADGVVAVVWQAGELLFLNDEIKNHEDMEYYLNRDIMTDENDVIILFDDGHVEWGFYGDQDFVAVGDQE